MRRMFGFVLLGLALSFLLRSESIFLGRGIDPGEGVSLLQGRALCEGYLPYTKYFDSRGPLLYVNFAAAQSIFGERVLGCRLWTAMCVGMAAAFVGLIARHLLHANAPAIAAMLAVVLLTTCMPGLTAVGELIVLPWITLAMLLALQASEHGPSAGWLKTIAAGLCLGIAIQTNLVAGIELPAMLLAICISPHRRVKNARTFLTRSGVMVLAAFVPFLIVAASYAIAGKFGTFVFSAFTFNFLSLASTTVRSADVKRLLGDLAMFLPALPLLLVIAAGLFTSTLNRPLLLLSGAWLLASLLGVIANGRVEAHHLLTIVPALGLLAALGVDFVRQRNGASRYLAGTAIAAGIVLLGVDHVRRLPNLRSEHLESIRMAWLVNRYTYPGQIVFASNNDPIVYYISQTEPATRFVHPSWLGRKDQRDILGLNWNAEMKDILSKSPVLVTIRNSSGSWEPRLLKQLEAMLRSSYRGQRKARHASLYMLQTVDTPPLPPDAMP
jgi:4-amino-4-deoxy-L-arabinose transferase-like glycosyltransferase